MLELVAVDDVVVSMRPPMQGKNPALHLPYTAPFSFCAHTPSVTCMQGPAVLYLHSLQPSDVDVAVLVAVVLAVVDALEDAVADAVLDADLVAVDVREVMPVAVAVNDTVDVGVVVGLSHWSKYAGHAFVVPSSGAQKLVSRFLHGPAVASRHARHW